MNYAEQIIDLAKMNKGVVTSAQVTQAGIHRYYLNILVEQVRGTLTKKTLLETLIIMGLLMYSDFHIATH